MKVLQISTRYSTFLKDQVRVLEEKGVDCDVVVADHLPESEITGEENNGRIIDPGHNLPYYILRASKFTPEVLNKTIGIDYDIIHVNSGLAAPFGLIQPERPLVLTLWGSALMGDYLNGYYSTICKFCAQRYDEVIVRNSKMKQHLERDAHIIPSGVDLNSFYPISQKDAIEEVGWSQDTTNVIFPYSPDRKEQKNFELANKIIKKIRSQGHDIELKVVDGVPHERMQLYMNASDALLLTSRVEGSPNTVKEAMACNLPVVSVDVGDVKTRLRNTNNSYVCETEEDLINKLKEAIQNESDPNSRKCVEEVSLDTMGENIIDIYEGLL